MFACSPTKATACKSDISAYAAADWTRISSIFLNLALERRESLPNTGYILYAIRQVVARVQPNDMKSAMEPTRSTFIFSSMDKSNCLMSGKIIVYKNVPFSVLVGSISPFILRSHLFPQAGDIMEVK